MIFPLANKFIILSNIISLNYLLRERDTVTQMIDLASFQNSEAQKSVADWMDKNWEMYWEKN